MFPLSIWTVAPIHGKMGSMMAHSQSPFPGVFCHCTVSPSCRWDHTRSCRLPMIGHTVSYHKILEKLCERGVGAAYSNIGHRAASLDPDSASSSTSLCRRPRDLRGKPSSTFDEELRWLPLVVVGSPPQERHRVNQRYSSDRTIRGPWNKETIDCVSQSGILLLWYRVCCRNRVCSDQEHSCVT